MPELKMMRPSDPQAQTSDHESIDRRIAALRSSVERDSHDTDGGDAKWVQTTSRPPRRFLRRASRLIHGPAFEIRVYGFSVALAVFVGWLIASKL
jgi:hypothetical protein